jgi:hypothetical protein
MTMTAIGWTAVALAAAGVAAISFVLLHWQATHEFKRPFPPWAYFAMIGGWLALMGAVCFAIAFMLRG